MASYYAYYAVGMSALKQIRWTMYNEISTSNELITGCLPAYDRSFQSHQLLGVICMDVSLIIGVPEFKKKPDYQEAFKMMQDDARECFRTEHSEETLESLRGALEQSFDSRCS